MKLALSILCENPLRKTGLTTLFHEFVKHSVAQLPTIEWQIFAGTNQEWSVNAPQIAIDRNFPANDCLNQRLIADHFFVPAAARRAGADALLTVGFVPARKPLPTVMHVSALQHLDRRNKVGAAHELYRRWLTKYRWPAADLVITNSKFALHQLLAVYPELRNRAIQSYEGLQHDQFHPQLAAAEVARLRDRFDLSPGYFLWISNFYPYKQPELLVRAYAALPTEVRRKHPLVMVGGDWDNTLPRIQSQVRTLGIEREVRFLDWIEDEWLAPLYRHARVFCLASREETFRRCVLEAMACGTPCIVNDIPVMREVTDGAAILLDFQQTSSVANALLEIATHSKMHTTLSARGLQRAADFSFEKLTSERIMAIQRLVFGRESRGGNGLSN